MFSFRTLTSVYFTVESDGCFLLNGTLILATAKHWKFGSLVNVYEREGHFLVGVLLTRLRYPGSGFIYEMQFFKCSTGRIQE